MEQTIHVLLIEDNLGDAELIHLSLLGESALHFDIIWKQRLSEAVEYLQQSNPDIILLDLGLPDSVGPDTVKRMRQAAGSIPIVVMTGNADEQIGLAVIQSGAQDHVVKTNESFAVLSRILQYALERFHFDGKQRAKEENYHQLFTSMQDGFALHEIVLDGEGNPVDYVFLAVNPAFERITGLKAQDVVGKTVRAVLPTTEKEWIERYGRVALTGEPCTFEHYSRSFDRYFQTTAYSPGYLLFACKFLDVTDRIRTEEKLRQNETSLRALIDAVDHSLFLMALDGTVAAINETTAARMGSSVEAMIGTNIYDYVPEETAQHRRRFAEQVIQTGEPVFFADQRFGRWIDNAIYPVLNADGVVTWLAIYGRDFTEQKRAEESLRLSEERFKILFEQAPLGMALTDSLTGHYISINQRFAEIAGRSIEELATLDWMQYTHPDDVQADLDQMALLNAGEIPGFQMEKRFVHPDGKIVWINMTVAPVDVTDKNHPRHLCMIEDITERKQASLLLRESEERYRLISQVSSDYMFASHVDNGGNLVQDWTVGALEEITGYPFEEYFATGGWRGHIHPDDVWIDDRDMALLRQNQNVNSELRLARKDGRVCWVRVSALPVWDAEKGKLSGIYGSVLDITDRKLAEENIRLQARMLDVVGQSVITTDMQGRIIYWNTAAEKLFGWMAEEALGRDILAVTVSDATIEQASEIMAHLQAGESWTGEFFARHKDGTAIPLQVTDMPVTNEAGELVGIIGVSFDLTERRQAEQALRDNEKKFRALFENNHAVMLLIDPITGRIVDANQAASVFYGWNIAALIAKDIFEINVLDESDVKREMQKALIEEQNYFQFRHCLASGEIRDVEVYSVPIADKGEPLLYSIVHDVTERNRAEQALREREEQFRSMFESANVGKSMTSPSGEITVNKAYAEMLGYSESELAHKTWQELTPPEEIAVTEALLKPLLRGEKDALRFEKRYLHKDGSLVWTDVSTVMHRDSAGTPLYFITTVVNITERKAAEDALRQKVDELERFNTLTVDRELRMVALKQEINALLAAAGLPPKYRIIE